MLPCLTLARRSEHSAASRGICPKWWDLLVISEADDRLVVDARELRYAGGKRLPVVNTWSTGVQHDARCPVHFVTVRERDSSLCGRIEKARLRRLTGSKSRAGHFCEILGQGDDTLRGTTVSQFFFLLPSFFPFFFPAYRPEFCAAPVHGYWSDHFFP